MGNTKRYSLSEVSRHISAKDCWVVIHGKVYDVSKFLEEHPGGEEALLQSAAKGDATADFEDVGHSSAANALMTCYYLGDLKDSDSSDDDTVAVEEARLLAARESQVKQSSFDFMKLTPIFIIVLALAIWFYGNKAKAY